MPTIAAILLITKKLIEVGLIIWSFWSRISKQCNYTEGGSCNPSHNKRKDLEGIKVNNHIYIYIYIASH